MCSSGDTSGMLNMTDGVNATRGRSHVYPLDVQKLPEMHGRVRPEAQGQTPRVSVSEQGATGHLRDEVPGTQPGVERAGGGRVATAPHAAPRGRKEGAGRCTAGPWPGSTWQSRAAAYSRLQDSFHFLEGAAGSERPDENVPHAPVRRPREPSRRQVCPAASSGPQERQAFPPTCGRAGPLPLLPRTEAFLTGAEADHSWRVLQADLVMTADPGGNACAVGPHSLPGGVWPLVAQRAPALRRGPRRRPTAPRVCRNGDVGAPQTSKPEAETAGEGSAVVSSASRRPGPALPRVRPQGRPALRGIST